METMVYNSRVLDIKRRKCMKICKSCRKEIDDKATKCPNCQTDQRNWFMKHKIVTGILGIIIFFVLVGAIGGSKSSSTTSASSNSNTNTSATTNTTTDQGQPQVKQAKVGDTVTDGDLGFTVQSVSIASTIGNSFTTKTAQGVFYVLTVKIQNNGKDTKTINASDFKVTDSQGRKFDYSTDGQLAMEETNGGTSFFLQQVQPSLSVTGKIVFDVPKDATGLKLLAQGGLFTDGVQIDLGK